MGRPKKELRKLHRKKLKKAKEKLKAYLRGEISYSKLTQRAKRILEKKKQEKNQLN